MIIVQIHFFPLKKVLNSAWLVGWFMVFNTTFNSISVTLWRSDLLLEETAENPSQTLSHNVV